MTARISLILGKSALIERPYSKQTAPTTSQAAAESSVYKGQFAKEYLQLSCGQTNNSKEVGTMAFKLKIASLY
jgi:hypothetical protein